MNRYNESPNDALKILNAIPENTRDNVFNVRLMINGVQYEKNLIDDNGIWSGNPLMPTGISIHYKKDNEDYTDWDWETFTMMPSDIKDINVTTGDFIFMNKNGDTLILTKKQNKLFNFNNF
jgi:hypothetical protein